MHAYNDYYGMNEYFEYYIDVPNESTNIPLGEFSAADVARPPSPLKSAVPVPAIVVTTPAVTLRMR